MTFSCGDHERQVHHLLRQRPRLQGNLSESTTPPQAERRMTKQTGPEVENLTIRIDAPQAPRGPEAHHHAGGRGGGAAEGGA